MKINFTEVHCFVCNAKNLIHPDNVKLDRIKVKSDRNNKDFLTSFIYNRYYCNCPICNIKLYITKDFNNILNSFANICDIDVRVVKALNITMEQVVKK
jgi:hypothetical protein